MKDFTEVMESLAEARYEFALQPDGYFKCVCGRMFNLDHEGEILSPNPWAMPVCGVCAETYRQETVSKQP